MRCIPPARPLSLLLGVTALLACRSIPAFSAPPPIQARAAVLLDVETGTVLFQQNMHQSRPFASTTKIMTALLALENCSLDDLVSMSPTAAAVQGSSLYLDAGQVMRLDDLLAAVLLRSANDAAIAIAEHISGSVPAFASLMNERARQLGATDTHFVNPHGLHDRDHRSSAYDLALITRRALEHPRFRELVAAEKLDIQVPTDPSGLRRLHNHNKLLRRADFVDGVKTGYVNESGQCLVASGTEDGRQLVAVLLDSPDIYREALSLLRYGFADFDKKVFAEPGDALGRATIRGGTEPSVSAVCQGTLVTVVGPDLPDQPRLEVTLNGPLPAPVAQGDPVGQVRLVAGRTVLARAPLVAGQAISRALFPIVAIWTLRSLVVVVILVLLIRQYAKAVKANRRRRLRLPS